VAQAVLGADEALGVAAELVGHLACVEVVETQQGQHLAAAAHRALEQLALHVVHAGLVQRHGVHCVARTRHQLQVRPLLTRQGHQAVGLVHVVHRHHQHLRVGGAGGGQQVGLRRVAEVHLEAQSACAVHGLGVVIHHGGLDARGQQQARHDLPVAPEARQQHGGAFVRDGIGCARGRVVARIAVEQLEQQRRERHGNGGDEREQRRILRRQHLHRLRGGQDHEGEFAALREQHRQQ